MLLPISEKNMVVTLPLKYIQNPAAATATSLQSCPTLCDPIDGSLPGFSVPGILQARVLEWGAIAFSAFLLYLEIKFYDKQTEEFHSFNISNC